MPRPSPRPPADDWPDIPLAAWLPTLETLQFWLQIVGKVQLALAPWQNEWWGIAQPLTARGLTTGLLPATPGATGRGFTVDLDFVEHRLAIAASDGASRGFPLAPMTVADFHDRLLGQLGDMGIVAAIDPVCVELPVKIRLDRDRENASYDAEAVGRWWQAMLRAGLVLQQFRSGFAGKASPIQFFWGSFDLSHTRYTGRPAAPPASWPRFMRLAEDEENFSCGFWPGNVGSSGLTFGEPAFYAYAFPEPAGFRDATDLPPGARFDTTFGEYLLPWAAARSSPDPAATVLAFLQTTYATAAEAGGWDRARLEPAPPALAAASPKGARP